MVLFKPILLLFAASMASLGASQFTLHCLPPDLEIGISKIKKSGMLMGMDEGLGHPRPMAPEHLVQIAFVFARNLQLVADSFREEERAPARYLLAKMDPSELRTWTLELPMFCRTAEDSLDLGLSAMGMQGPALDGMYAEIENSARRIRASVRRLEEFYQCTHEREVSQAPAWARPALAGLLANGLLHGYPEGDF